MGGHLSQGYEFFFNVFGNIPHMFSATLHIFTCSLMPMCLMMLNERVQLHGEAGFAGTLSYWLYAKTRNQ